jgi:hypothetical protein
MTDAKLMLARRLASHYVSAPQDHGHHRRRRRKKTINQQMRHFGDDPIGKVGTTYVPGSFYNPGRAKNA